MGGLFGGDDDYGCEDDAFCDAMVDGAMGCMYGDDDDY